MIVVREVQQGPVTTTVRLSGHAEHSAGDLRTADRAAADVVAATLEQGAEPPAVDLDLTEVDRADLATVEQLARITLALRRAGREPRLRRPSPMLQAILELTGLASGLQRDPDRTEDRSSPAAHDPRRADPTPERPS